MMRRRFRLRGAAAIGRRFFTGLSTLLAMLLICLAWRSDGVTDVIHVGGPQSEVMFHRLSGDFRSFIFER